MSGTVTSSAWGPADSIPNLGERYSIVRELGRGGMGRVYLARDQRLGRDVAIKVLAPGRTDELSLRRFEQEARAAGALAHPNILDVHDIATENGAPYIVSELLQGRTLRERLGGQPLPVRIALGYAVQLAQGLAAAHDKGIVHRDLKPENLFVTDEGRLKILDFGIAKLAALDEEDATGPHTQTGAIVGTAGYMSPEQVRGEPADQRSDLFAFGAILFEMVAGRRAFAAATRAETNEAILHDEPPELPPQVPPSLRAVVLRCLEKEPAERFQSARDVGFALQALAVPGRRWTLRRGRRAGLLAAAAMAGLALVFAAGYATRRPQSHPPPRFKRLSTTVDPVWSARFAADGQSVIYTGGRSLKGPPTRLFTTRIDRPFSRPIGVDDARVVGVSPNGDAALILGSRVGLWSTAVGTGTLALLPPGGAPRELMKDVQTAGFLRDGSLWIVRKAQQKWLLESPPGTVLYASEAFLASVAASPDGQRFAFLDQPQGATGEDRGFVAVVDRAGNARRLSREFFSVHGVAWAPSGDEVWFGAEDPPDFALFAASLDGRERLLARSHQMLFLQDVDARGRALVRITWRESSVRCRGPGAREEVDCSGAYDSYMPRLSADGRRVLVWDTGVTDAATYGNYSMYLRGTDGATPVRVGDGVSLALSPDGSLVLAFVLKEGSGRLMLYPTGAGAARELPLDGNRFEALEAGAWGSAFSPDGKRVAVTVQRPDGTRQLMAGAVEGGGLAPLLLLGGRVLVCFADQGHEVVLRDRDGAWLAPIDGTLPRKLPIAVAPSVRLLGPAPGGLFWSRWRDDDYATEVFRLDFKTLESRLERTLPPVNGSPIGMLAFSADGAAYAYQSQREHLTLHLLEGLR